LRRVFFGKHAFFIFRFSFTIYFVRILQISSAKNFGGGERHFVDLCRGLTDKNAEIFVVVRPQATWLEQLSFLPEEKIIRLPLRNSLDVLSAFELAKIIRERKIQIVHAHLARDYPLAALAVKISRRAKLVLTRHVFFPLNFSYKFLLPKNTIFIAPTKAGKEKLLEQNIVSSERIHQIYYGINVKQFVEIAEKTVRADLLKKLNLSPEKKFVGIAGEITEHKGQLDFVRAAQIISEKFPETEFLIIGQDGSAKKHHLQRLEKSIAESGLGEKIHLLGFWADVAPLYAILDVFVSASHVEPFGLVIAEASASGCAVAATATDGASEIIIPEKTGKLVPIKNSEAIAQSVMEFLSDEETRAEFAQNALMRIEKNFSLEQMIGKTLNLYQNLLKN
jgi:glycosyltransferase involved in cell wall biosynthesis